MHVQIPKMHIHWHTNKSVLRSITIRLLSPPNAGRRCPVEMSSHGGQRSAPAEVHQSSSVPTAIIDEMHHATTSIRPLDPVWRTHIAINAASAASDSGQRCWPSTTGHSLSAATPNYTRRLNLAALSMVNAPVVRSRAARSHVTITERSTHDKACVESYLRAYTLSADSVFVLHASQRSLLQVIRFRPSPPHRSIVVQFVQLFIWYQRLVNKRRIADIYCS